MFHECDDFLVYLWLLVTDVLLPITRRLLLCYPDLCWTCWQAWIWGFCNYFRSPVVRIFLGNSFFLFFSLFFSLLRFPCRSFNRDLWSVSKSSLDLDFSFWTDKDDLCLAFRISSGFGNFQICFLFVNENLD